MEFDAFAPLPSGGGPIYLQLYQRYRAAIASGKLQPGERVASVRSLASALNLARGTVENAYQLLVSEGYFVSRGAAGTVVSPALARLAVDSVGAVASVPALSAVHGMGGAPLPFQPGLPAFDAFPRARWARLAGRQLRRLDVATMTYPHPAGHPALRAAIAAYLGIARGIACSPQQVFVTSGYGGALQLLCQTLLHSGDTGWYEDPGYVIGRQFLSHAGMRLVAVAVDEEGLQVDAGRRLADEARFAVVTPTHQSPTGVGLSLPRRLELLEWARARSAWIIEDDYDSEFRYHGRPLPALKSLDRDGRVLYTGTFSKVLFPGLRLAYLVVPPAEVECFRERVSFLPAAGSQLAQAVVADFMAEGHFARHLRRMRALYVERRQYLVQALEQQAADWLTVQPQAGGIQLLAHLRQHTADHAIARAARARGLALHARSEWTLASCPRPGLIMGFANFRSADEAGAAVVRLCEVLRRGPAPLPPA